MKKIVGNAKAYLTARKLRKVTDESWIAGVCAGTAYWLRVPVWVVRLLWTSAIFLFGVGVGVYILLWIFMPEWEEDPEDFKEIAGG